jgi:hypothetical protein
MNQIVLLDGQVKDMEALAMCVEGIGRLTGAEVTMTHQVIISTENVPAYFALRDLLKVEQTKTKKMVDRSDEVKWKGTEKPILQGEKKSRLQVLYEILDGPKTGQKYRGPSIALMMKAGNLAAGTRLSHPERGKLIVVTNGRGTFTLQAVPE